MLHSYSLVIVPAALSERLFFAQTKGATMTVRAKFRCHFIQKADDNSHCTVHMSPVTDDTPENKTWSKYTPGGLLQMHISNPAAFSQFEQGKEYYIDIQPA